MSEQVSESKATGVKVLIGRNNMSASIIISSPDKTKTLTKEEVLRELSDAGVVFGIDEKIIEKTIEDRVLNKPVEIAFGLAPVKGKNATFEYFFETSKTHRPQEDEDGRIDFKNINFIQNIEKDQPLVKKIPAEDGQPGKDVLGNEIAGIPGRDNPFKNGTNTEISEDGLTLYAKESGAIIYQNGKVSVDNVTVIRGDIDFNVGNIYSKGSVKVTGDVKTGFTIETDGDLEVNGNVEDSNIKVKGNVVINGGFFGNHEGGIEAGGEVMVKYVENQIIKAGRDITVGGEVINSTLVTEGNIFVKGKYSKVVGGELVANLIIQAGVFGSDSATETVVRVAHYPQYRKRLREVKQEIERLENDLARIKDSLTGLYKIQLDGLLNPKQEEGLKQLEELKEQIPVRVKELDEERTKIEEELKKSLESKVYVDEMVYPGVKVYFGIIYKEVMDEMGQGVFVFDGQNVDISSK